MGRALSHKSTHSGLATITKNGSTRTATQDARTHKHIHMEHGAWYMNVAWRRRRCSCWGGEIYHFLISSFTCQVRDKCITSLISKSQLTAPSKLWARVRATRGPGLSKPSRFSVRRANVVEVQSSLAVLEQSGSNSLSSVTLGVVMQCAMPTIIVFPHQPDTTMSAGV